MLFEKLLHRRRKNVALALSSGGPRGFAYIGALEELEARGYSVKSIAGTSIGSLVGGVYAAGGLSQFKEWLFTLDTWKVVSLMDISLSLNSFVKGDRIIEAMKEVVPDVLIEELPIPYCAIATDLNTGEEVVFDKGNLFDAIRASMSIPSMFRPVQRGRQLLVDGHSSNCLPLNRVKRTKKDILVGFDLNEIDVEAVNRTFDDIDRTTSDYEQLRTTKREEVRSLAAEIKQDSTKSLLDKVKLIGASGWAAWREVVAYREAHVDTLPETDWGSNAYGVIDRVFSIMNYHNSRLMIELCKPDILVKMPFDAYGDISDYALARDISELGRELMAKALDEYEGVGQKTK